jgi:hypothetical protein
MFALLVQYQQLRTQVLDEDGMGGVEVNETSIYGPTNPAVRLSRK